MGFTFNMGNAYWPFTPSTSQRHWSKSSCDTNHLSSPIQPPILAIMTHWPAHIYAAVFATVLAHVWISVTLCVSTCINVFDPDINSVGTKLSSPPLTDVKTGLISTRHTLWDYLKLAVMFMWKTVQLMFLNVIPMAVNQIQTTFRLIWAASI